MHVLTLTPFYPTAEDDASGCFIAESVGELRRQGIESTVIAVQPMHHSHPGYDPKAPPATWKRYFCLPGNPGLSSAGQFLFAALNSTSVSCTPGIRSACSTLTRPCPAGRQQCSWQEIWAFLLS